MNIWFRRYEEENPGDGSGAGGDAPPEAPGTADPSPDAPAKPGTADVPPKQMTEAEVTAGMDEAIARGLGYKKSAEDEAKEAEAAKKKEADAVAAAAASPDAKAKAEADAKVRAATPPKAKTAAELDLKPEEKKLLHAKTQARFGEVITALKTHEATIAKQNETIAQLTEARESILGVLEETHTTDEQLGQLLEFNRMVQTGDLEGALKVVESQRAAIYKAMGKEGPGVDLLSEHPDLLKEVEEERLTRERALEISNARRLKAQQEARARGDSVTRDQQKEAEQKAQAALDGIDKWCRELARTDIDYKGKEGKLLPKVADVIKKYTPDQWLPTLQLLYEGISVERAAPAPGPGGKQPLRPSGQRPGGAAPATMLDAINQGLGYNQP